VCGSQISRRSTIGAGLAALTLLPLAGAEMRCLSFIGFLTPPKMALQPSRTQDWLCLSVRVRLSLFGTTGVARAIDVEALEEEVPVVRAFMSPLATSPRS
jgi:hypothetical protein